LLRHAKSDWNQPKVADHDRVLNKRGRRSAKEIAETVRREGITPDVTLVSSAKRAQETVAKLDLPLTKDAALYNASATDLLTRVRSLSEDVQSVLLVGHNPGIEELAGQLSDEDGMSTATLLAFDVEAPTWAELDVSSGRPAGRWEHPGEK
jgi:phosphohistidine phosphatase